MAIITVVLLAGCGPITVVERVPQTVVVTPEVPEVTRQVTVQVTVPVTKVVTREVPATVIVTATPVPPPERLSDAAASQAALRWLVSQQRNDGGFGSVRSTAWAVLALATAGVAVGEVEAQTGRTPLDYLDSVIVTGQVAGAENTALTMLALVRAGHAPPEPVALTPSPAPTTWPALPLFVLALGDSAPDEVAAALMAAQAEDGGFGGVVETAWATLALVSAGEDAAAARALTYLRARQRTDGAWPAARDDAPDPFATALSIQALVAREQNLARWRDPLHALLRLQQDNGSFAGDVPTTSAAIIAIHEAKAGATP